MTYNVMWKAYCAGHITIGEWRACCDYLMSKLLRDNAAMLNRMKHM